MGQLLVLLSQIKNTFMFKFLSDEQSVRVKGEYRLRRLVMVVFLLVICLTILLISLIPAYVTSYSRQTEAESLINTLNQSPTVKEGQSLQTWLVNINKKLSALSPDKNMDMPYELFVKVLDNKVNGVRITGLSYRKVGKVSTLFIAGVARDRQVLLSFEDKLNLSKQFSKVNIPASTFAKDKDINFEINMTPIKQ